jgi:hypothetical protein
MRKSSLRCPNCGHTFEISDLRSKKMNSIAMDEVVVHDKIGELSGFGLGEETEEGAGLHDSPVVISVAEDLDDIKVS